MVDVIRLCGNGIPLEIPKWRQMTGWIWTVPRENTLFENSPLYHSRVFIIFPSFFVFFSSRYRLSGLLRMVYRGDIADWVTALLSEPLPSLRCPVWSINRSINHPVIFGRRNIGSLFLNSQLLYVCGVMVGGETTKFLVDTVEGGRIKRKKNKKKIL